MSLLDEKARLSSPSRSSSSIGFLSPSAVSTSHRTPSPPADRQNAICKAMGALFLQHRVQCLEEDVAKLDRKNFHLGGKHKGRDGRGGGPHMGREPGKKSGCPFQRRAEKYKTVATSEEMPQSRAELLVVVDASVLIYSLRSVHEWLKEGKTRVVIPDEACRTLDVLKTKEDRLGLAARKAARFIEERMVQGRQADVTHSPAPQSVQTPSRRSSWYRCPSATSSVSRPRSSPAVGIDLTPGLIIQPEGARMSPVEAQTMRASKEEKNSLEELAAIRPGAEALNRSGASSLQDCPIFIRETLLCALYYLQLLPPSTSTPPSPAADSPRMALAIAYPPPRHLESGHAEEEIRYLERVNPDALVDRCAAYGIFDIDQDSIGMSGGAPAVQSGEEGGATGRLIVLPTAASWLLEGSEDCRRGAHARGVDGGHAGGRCHRGGRGGGGDGVEGRGGCHRGRGRGGFHGGPERGGAHRGGGRGGGRGRCHRGAGRGDQE